MSAMRSRPDKNSGDDKPKKERGKDKPYEKGAAPVTYGFKKAKSKDWNKEDKGERSGPAESKSKASGSYKSYRDDDRPRRKYDKAGEGSGASRDESKPRRSFDKPGEGTHASGEEHTSRSRYVKPGERGGFSRDESRPRRSYDKSKEGSGSSRDEHKPHRSYEKPGEGRGFSRDESRPRRKYDKPEKEHRAAGDDHKPRRSWTDKPEHKRDEWQKRPASGREESKFVDDKSGSRGDDRPKRRRENADGQQYRASDRERSSTWKKEEGSGYKSRERREDVKPYKRKSSGPGPRSGVEMPKGKSGFNAEGTIRLNKYIANSGVCSRREADELIVSGAVTVNGEVVTQLGTRITREDKVEFGGETLNIEKKVYLLLNKPKGYITTVDDPADRNTVMLLVKDACRERIYPVGRLDRNTTGLLLLTNDGEVTKKLTHPSHRVRKVYHVELDKALTKSDMERLTEGIELEDGMMAVDEIAYTGKSDDKKNIGIVIHSGRNRIVRRLFEVLEYNVVKLDRVAFANLTKKDLPRGKWRMLDQNEINLLMMI